jgi:hypothetical protein
MNPWPEIAALKAVGLRHPSYRPGWVFRDDHVAHVSCKAKWVVDHGQALVAAAPTIHSMLVLGASHAEIASLADCPWLHRFDHLGLVVKRGAQLDPLLSSRHLGALRSLDLNWTSNDPAYFPHDLTPKTLRPLLSSPILGQLRSLRVSVSSVALLLELLEVSTHLEHLGVRMQGGFSAKGAARIGAAMNLPALVDLSVPTGVAPASAARLRCLRVRGGGLPADADLSGIERLRLDNVFAPALAQTLDGGAPNLRSLEIGCARPDQAGECMAILAAAQLPSLEDLSVHAAPCEPSTLELAVGADWWCRLRELSLTVTAPDSIAAALGEAQLTALRLWWQGDAVPVLGELDSLTRLSLGYRFGDAGDAAIRATLAQPRPRLEQLAMATVQNQPSATEVGIRTLLERAPASLDSVYLRLGKLPRKLATQVRDRFRLYDGGTKLSSPFAGLNDWTWPWLPWGPPLWAIDED